MGKHQRQGSCNCKRMQKKLVTFGDSWPWGAELNATEKPFGFWIAEDLGYEFENCAEEGTSIEHMILQLQKYTAKNKMDTTAIFFITNPIRTMHYQGGQWLTYRPTGQKTAGHEAYYKYVQSDKLDYHRAQVFILALQRICQQNNIKDYYIEGWTNIDWNYTGIDTLKMYPRTATQILDVDLNPRTSEISKYQQSQYIKPHKYHPNELGHKRIAEELLQWIS